MQSKLFVAVVVLFACVASATAQTTWKDPFGSFTLAIPEEWTMVPPEEVRSNSRSAADLIAIPATENKDLPKTGCSVFRLNHSAPSELVQTMANAVLEDWDQNLVVEEASRGQNKVIEVRSFSNDVRSGVRVVSMNYVFEVGESKLMYRQSQFMLALGGSRAAFFTLSCFAPLSEKGSTAEGAKALFESLRFR